MIVKPNTFTSSGRGVKETCHEWSRVVGAFPNIESLLGLATAEVVKIHER